MLGSVDDFLVDEVLARQLAGAWYDAAWQHHEHARPWQSLGFCLNPSKHRVQTQLQPSALLVIYFDTTCLRNGADSFRIAFSSFVQL